MIPRTAPRVRVRIAADDHGARRSLTTARSTAGFEVTAVDDGELAIALAGAAAFEIADLHRTTGGLAVIPHDKQRHGAGVYCAVLSGEDDEATREACLAAGADEASCTPFPAVDLRRLTEAALALRASTAGDEAPGRLNFLAGSASLFAGNGRHCHTGKGDGGRG